MRLAAPLIVACALFSLLLSGTANAATHPIRDPVLTKNKLYGTGELEPSECRERHIKRKHVPSAKRYITSVLNCLNASWQAHFERAGLRFAKARVGFITKPRRFCGHSWDKNVAAMYCDTDRRFLVLLDDEMLANPGDLFLFKVVAHEYGHHVQQVTGMARAFQRYPYKGKSELNEQIRRSELQAECLAGAFMGSVWDSLDRTKGEWEDLLDVTLVSGDEWAKARDHGKGRNIAAWLKRGFQAASPDACNTWTAPSSKVA
ncbi:neutral zinc metallopeptidase [Nonomuraea lactucae]|uniref:neutral zinc metallopeptidase n=1 Tax=Nonomuraea lactucae TaxID=2249762 RepID=UPI0013B447F4|nr:neutral zinc metallopeptidase [Nonomuraea lactucae]